MLQSTPRRGAGIGAFSARVRKSPFFASTQRWGAKGYSVYNHMYMPLYYDSPEADFRTLVEAVSLWDVAVERQVEISGPDAARLAQHLSPRDLSKMQPGQCKYVLLCDQHGGVINDPVLLKLAEDRYWFSLADSDALLWAKGLAAAGGFDVEVVEPDVSPLQVQGPRSPDVMRGLFGDWVDELKYFRFRETELDGIPVIVSRTGWSNERGYEIFLRDGSQGEALWERIMAAGEAYGIGPGAPSSIRRIEAGLLSYGADMDLSVNPYELDLGRLVDLEMAADFVGKAALRRIAEAGPARKLRGLRLDGPALAAANEEHWPVGRDGETVGKLTSAVHSPRLGQNIALALIARPHWDEGTELQVTTPEGPRRAEIVPLPFYDPKKALVRG